MSPHPVPHRSGHRRSQAPGPQHCPGIGRRGWQVAVHYRASAQDAMDTVAACADLAALAPILMLILKTKAAVRNLVPRVIAHFGQLDAVVNSASLFEHDDVQTFGFAALEKHLRSNTATPVLLAQALHRHVADRVAAGEADARGAVVNLLDQKLWNQNPDFVSYTLSKAALEAAGTMLALALARACAWWAWPRPDADQPHAERRKVCPAARLEPPWAAHPRPKTWPPP